MSKPPVFACQFEFTPDSRAVAIALFGKLDPQGVEELHPQVQEVYRAGLRRFVFDLAHMEYAGSLGLRLFVGLANQVRGEGTVALCRPTDAVREMLNMTKLTILLPVYATREEALAAVASHA